MRLFQGVSSLSDLRLAGNVDGLLNDVTGLVGFAFHLNHMGHLKMFPTNHLRTMKNRNQTKFKYISVPYGHDIVPLNV